MAEKSKAAEHKAKGNSAFQSEEYEEAIRHFSEAISCDPSDHVLYSNRSGAHAALHKYEDALKDAEKCVSLCPCWAKGYSRKGLAEFHLGRVNDAEQTYKKGLEVDPNNQGLKDALNALAVKDANMADMQAMIAANMAVKNNPKLKAYLDEDPEYITRLVDILKQVQTNPAALRFVLQQPDVRIKEGILAVLGIQTPDEEEAEKPKPPPKKTETPMEPEKTPEQKEADIWKEKGNKLYKSKQFEDALEAYDKAISINPKDITYLNNKAAVYLEMGNYDQCIAECQAALDKRTELRVDYSVMAKVYNRMAACYTRMKNYEKAIAMYEKSLLEENSRHTRNALKDVQRLKDKAEVDAYRNPELAEERRLEGNEFFKNADYPAAKKAYDEAIRRNPFDAKLYTNRAAALSKLLEYPSAMKDCEKALELDPTFVKGWSRKGNLHFLMKEYHRALQAFDKGLLLEPENQDCRDGKFNVMMKIQETSKSTEVDEEQYRHAMADPEIQQILGDVQFQMILKGISENPSTLHEYLRDPKIASGIQKLMAAGILRVG